MNIEQAVLDEVAAADMEQNRTHQESVRSQSGHNIP